MNRLTRRLHNNAATPNAADCAYCDGEYMTKRGCSRRCPTRKEQIERLAAYEDTGLEPHEIENLHERLNEEDAKVGKWAVCVGDTFHGVKIVGADYEHKTVTLDWSENGGANE